MGKFIKKKCDKCERKFRRLYLTKGNFICADCLSKIRNIIPTARPQTLQEALSKIRIVRGYGKKYIHGNLHLPPVLIGRKVRIILVNDDGKEIK